MSFWDEVNGDALSTPIDHVARNPHAEHGFVVDFKDYNHISLPILSAIGLVIVVGMTLSRATVILSRNETGLNYVKSSPSRNLFGFLSILSIAAVFLASLWITHWYWPVSIFIFGSIVSAFLATANTSHLIYKNINLIGAGLVMCTIFLYMILWDKF